MIKGIDLRYIRKLFVNKSSKTTKQYPAILKISLANIKSPLDHFFESIKLDDNELQKES